MRRLAVATALLALPLVPARAAAPPPATVTYVAERTSAAAKELTVRGGAGARDHEYALAAVASATVGRDGRFAGADGALFFGSTAEDGAVVRTPVAQVKCKDIANGLACANDAGAAIGFAVWWDETPFNRVFVVLHGRNISADLGEHGSPGWRLRRWTGTTKLVNGMLEPASAGAPAGAGASAFARAQATGGQRGSVTIGHPPCTFMSVLPAGSGAVRLLGGEKDVVGTCADQNPPGAYAPAGAEWTLDGAAAGYSDVTTRLVVIEPPVR